jgi:hypothetical protein
MSWSIHLVGTPEGVRNALDAESERLSGDSKEEFDAAKPHLQALVALNLGDVPPAIRIEASGHASRKDGKVIYGTCRANVENLGARLVT